MARYYDQSKKNYFQKQDIWSHHQKKDNKFMMGENYRCFENQGIILWVGEI